MAAAVVAMTRSLTPGSSTALQLPALALALVLVLRVCLGAAAQAGGMGSLAASMRATAAAPGQWMDFLTSVQCSATRLLQDRHCLAPTRCSALERASVPRHPLPEALLLLLGALQRLAIVLGAPAGGIAPAACSQQLLLGRWQALIPPLLLSLWRRQGPSKSHLSLQLPWAAVSHTAVAAAVAAERFLRGRARHPRQQKCLGLPLGLSLRARSAVLALALA